METIKTTQLTETKKARITKDEYGYHKAWIIQTYKGEEQVLSTKEYKSLKRLEKWIESKI